MAQLPLPVSTEGKPIKLLGSVISDVLKIQEPLVIVSTICPSYSTDSEGRSTYEGLETDISPNTQKHFDFLVPAVKHLMERGVDTTHFFLMADTEVDLLPFLRQLDISPIEFKSRCQKIIDKIKSKVTDIYGDDNYSKIYGDKEVIPPAARFLDYFGFESWDKKYNYYLNRLLQEREREPYGRVAQGLEHDFRERSILIHKLLGNISKDEGVRHIARQKAQYMAFAALMRDKFGNNLVVANHRTPNFSWMNDKITREPTDQDQLAKGNYLNKLPLIELDISSMPN